MHTKTSHNYQKFVGSMLIQILRSSGLQCCFGQTWFLALLNKPRFLSIGQLKRSPSKSPPVGTSEADALSIRPLGLVWQSAAFDLSYDFKWFLMLKKLHFSISTPGRVPSLS